MTKYLVGIPAAAILAIVLVLNIVIAHDANAPAGGSVNRIRVTTSRTCDLPRLPAWIRSPGTTQIAGVDSFYHNAVVPTYDRGGGTSLTTWRQQSWLFALTLPAFYFNSYAAVVEQAFGSIQLPGHGALVWNNPNHWQLDTVWCTGGTAYHLNVPNVSPTLALVVAKVVADWEKNHATLFACRVVRVSVTCQPVSAP